MARGKSSTVAVKFTGDVADLKRATGEAERELQGFGSRVGPKMRQAMVGVGLAAGAALTDALFTHLDNEASVARYKGSLGLSDADAARLGETAGAIYRDGFGDSFDEIAGTVTAAMSEIDMDLDDDILDEITRKALNFAEVFGTDASEAIGTVGYMLRNGLARDATEAFDVLTVGFQRTPQQLRDEIFPTFAEYSANFAALGIDATEAFSIMLSAGQNTSVGFDKVGDSVKEFLIRASDGSKASTEALKNLGLDAGQIADDLLDGGDAAEEAMAKVVTALLSVEDPSEQAATAVALFGTPIEDIALNELPQFLAALNDTGDALGDTGGAADAMGDDLDTNQRKVEAFGRKIKGELVDFIAEDAIPAIENLGDNWTGTLMLMEDAWDSFFGRISSDVQGGGGGVGAFLGSVAESLGIPNPSLGEVLGIGGDDKDAAPKSLAPPSRSPTPSPVVDRDRFGNPITPGGGGGGATRGGAAPNITINIERGDQLNEQDIARAVAWSISGRG